MATRLVGTSVHIPVLVVLVFLSKTLMSVIYLIILRNSPLIKILLKIFGQS